jgi:hypothetical protein
LDCLYGVGDLKTVPNGRINPKVITTTNVWTTLKFVYKSCFKSYEKLGNYLCSI